MTCSDEMGVVIPFDIADEQEQADIEENIQMAENQEPYNPNDARLRIRRLTPKECWRLQGFGWQNEDGTWNDELFEKAKAAGVSDSQLYKQAGNAVTRNVAYAIGMKIRQIELEEMQDNDD